jgi:hypothetical protein
MSAFFNPSGETRRSGDSGIAREERGAKDFSQGHVSGVIGAEVLAQSPDPGKQNRVRVAFEGKIGESRESLPGPRLRYLALRNKTA